MEQTGRTVNLILIIIAKHRRDTTMLNKEKNIRALAFIEEIIRISADHGLSISHEDRYGNFEVVPYDTTLTDWLLDAYDNTEKS